MSERHIFAYSMKPHRSGALPSYNPAVGIGGQCSDTKEGNPMRCVISVLGKDKSGIVAAISAVLSECNANIDDISQTILGDIFSMTMLVTLNTESAGFNKVQEELDRIGDEMGIQITLQREDVFDFMYKI